MSDFSHLGNQFALNNKVATYRWKPAKSYPEWTQKEPPNHTLTRLIVGNNMHFYKNA